MKSKLLFSIFYTCLQVLPAQNWIALDVPGAARHDDLFFLNDTLGWACNSFGKSLKTTDGGQTWSIHTVDSTNYLRSIEFMDADTGFCGALESPSYLFKTTDGGNTWTDITSQITGLSRGVCGLSCPGGRVVYGCGAWYSPAYVIKSLDGGLTWQFIDLSAYTSALVDIYFINQDTGWVSGKSDIWGQKGGMILFTSDGGQNWEVVHNTHRVGDYIWKMQQLDDSHWFASIERIYSMTAKTEILKSPDGINWTPTQVHPNYFRLQGIGFLTPELGWTGDEQLFETQDGGTTWQLLNIALFNGYGFNRVIKRNDQKAFASGVYIYRYDAAASSATEPANSTPTGDFHGLTITPNPVREKAEIRIDLRQKTTVLLQIFDMEGKLIQTLWTGEHPEGEYLLQPDTDRLPPGACLVYFKTHHGTQTALLNKL